MEAEIVALEEFVPINHVALPVHVPDLGDITNQELQAIRACVQSLSRDARKKANVAISKAETLRPLWLRTVSLGTKMKDEDRKPVLAAFEKELLRHPQAFVNYSLANSLASLDATLKEEALRRTKLEPRK